MVMAISTSSSFCCFLFFEILLLYSSVLATETEGAIRLVGGESSTDGLLEVYHSGQWGTVCDDGFDTQDAQVACRQLGYTGGSVRDGDGSGPIWIDELNCAGHESAIVDCSRNSWGDHDCSHSEDVAIACDPVTATETEGAIRLVGGESSTDGRLEVYHSGQWGTVCDDGFGTQDAQVACRQLGYTGGFERNGYGYGPIWIDELNCAGHESAIVHCSSNNWGDHDCSHSEDVAIACDPVTGAIRLVGGESSSDGQLEVYYKGQWGTVCDDGFDTRDAQVACRQLGYTGGSVCDGQSGSGPIWIDDLNCGGHESAIVDCGSRNWGEHNCGHSEDVSIACDPIRDLLTGAIRLVGDRSSTNGRLEVYPSGQWGTVSDDNILTRVTRKVSCRQLGNTGASVRDGLTV